VCHFRLGQKGEIVVFLKPTELWGVLIGDRVAYFRVEELVSIRSGLDVMLDLLDPV